MSEHVHILATVRKADLLPAATLVFGSLRVGFPEAEVTVWGNGMQADFEKVLVQAAMKVGGNYRSLVATSHDVWIESLVQGSMHPFWICDTDVVFWDQMPVAFVGGPAFAGRFEPEFEEEWTNTRHVERLHTAVMWLDPPLLRGGMRDVLCAFREPWRNSAEFPFIRQHVVPRVNRNPLFYDTCAGLWQAGIAGHPFTEDEDKRFDHLHCGTYIDLVGPHLSAELEAAHQRIYANPEIARGIRTQQAAYYESRKPKD